MCSWQETVRTPTESWQEGDFRSYWKDLLPKWLEFRHSVDGGIVVTVGWWLRFWEGVVGRQYPSKSNKISSGDFCCKT